VKPVLVDTSVWRHYFAGTAGENNSARLAELLDLDDAVLCHRAVLGELVLGGLSPREEALFVQLPMAPDVSQDEVLDFVRQRKLVRKGVGWVDCHLLASALVANTLLWSMDRRLAKAADTLDIAFASTKARNS